MNILAIDTATDACSIALLIDDVLHEHFVIAPQQHAKRLLNDIEHLLKSHSIALKDIDIFAYGRGPGSFTGVRIAASVVQALAYANEKPVAAVSNLEALAFRAHRLSACTTVMAAIDARMQEIYWAFYEYDSDSGRMKARIAEQVSGPSALSEYELAPFCLIGNAWQSYHESLSQIISPETLLEEELPHAEDIAQIALLQAQNNELIPAEQAIPVYLRDNVAHKKKA